jgi:ethanolamine utilization protein EutA
MQTNTLNRVILLGLDFGSTTSSALVASASISSNAMPFKALTDIKIEHLCEPVLTPFLSNTKNNVHAIDVEKITLLINQWLNQSGVKIDAIFSGGSMITGLAAQADNAQALTEIITNLVGESVIATADDPCLESWLAFMGSCGALSRYHADAPMINFDIGGGTTNIAVGNNTLANVALGVIGGVLQTGCYFIGARHFQFVAGGYQLTAISSYGVALLANLKIIKTIGETLSKDEIAKIMTFYVSALEAICLGNTDFFNTEIAQIHSQVAIKIAAKTKAYITFSGGVGELIYKIAANEALPTTTFYGDFGIDLAQAISRSPVLSANLKTHIPEHKGRATVMGLTLHSTELSGSSIYLPSPNILPLRNLPIVAKLPANASAEQWQNAFVLASNCKQGACIQVAEGNNLEQIRALATQIKHALQTNIHAASRPLVIMAESNIGKALGNYICDWGQLDYNLMVIDEVAPRNAQFVNIGRMHQGMIPVSFYGLN